jgi:hypothetical protein
MADDSSFSSDSPASGTDAAFDISDLYAYVGEGGKILTPEERKQRRREARARRKERERLKALEYKSPPSEESVDLGVQDTPHSSTNDSSYLEASEEDSDSDGEIEVEPEAPPPSYGTGVHSALEDKTTKRERQYGYTLKTHRGEVFEGVDEEFEYKVAPTRPMTHQARSLCRPERPDSRLLVGAAVPLRVARKQERRFFRRICEIERTVRNLGDAQVLACLKLSRTQTHQELEELLRTSPRPPTLTWLPPMAAFTPAETHSYLTSPIGTPSRQPPRNLLTLSLTANPPAGPASLETTGMECISGAPMCYKSSGEKTEKLPREGGSWTASRRFHIKSLMPERWLPISTEDVVDAHILLDDLAYLTTIGADHCLPAISDRFDIQSQTLSSFGEPRWSDSSPLLAALPEASASLMQRCVGALLNLRIDPAALARNALLRSFAEVLDQAALDAFSDYYESYMTWRMYILSDLLRGALALAHATVNPSTHIYLCTIPKECHVGTKYGAANMWRVCVSRVLDPVLHIRFTLYERTSLKHYAAALLVWNMIGRKCAYRQKLREDKRLMHRRYESAVDPDAILGDLLKKPASYWISEVFPLVYLWGRFEALSQPKYNVLPEEEIELAVPRPPKKHKADVRIMGTKPPTFVTRDSYHNPVLTLKNREILEKDENIQQARRIFNDAFEVVDAKDVNKAHIKNTYVSTRKAVSELLAFMHAKGFIKGDGRWMTCNFLLRMFIAENAATAGAIKYASKGATRLKWRRKAGSDLELLGLPELPPASVLPSSPRERARLLSGGVVDMYD